MKRARPQADEELVIDQPDKEPRADALNCRIEDVCSSGDVRGLLAGSMSRRGRLGPQVKGCMWGLAPAAAAPQPGRAGSRVGTCRGLDLAAPIRQPLNPLEVTGCDYYPGSHLSRSRDRGTRTTSSSKVAECGNGRRSVEAIPR